MRREVRNLYKALLKEKYVTAVIEEFVYAFEEYNAYRESVASSAIKRRVIKVYLPAIKKPQYIEWAEKYRTIK